MQQLKSKWLCSFNSRERTAKSANNSKREMATTCAKHAANRKKKVNKRQKRLKATSCIEIESKDKLKAPSAGERAHRESAMCAAFVCFCMARSHSTLVRLSCRLPKHTSWLSFNSAGSRLTFSLVCSWTPMSTHASRFRALRSTLTHSHTNTTHSRTAAAAAANIFELY